MSLQYSQPARKQKILLAVFGALIFATLITIGIFAKNDWFPSTDASTGRQTGWFGTVSAQPPSAPQLSKEYIYAGSRLLAVEDANANAAPPADLAVWRPSTGTWLVMGGQNSAHSTQNWGI